MPKVSNWEKYGKRYCKGWEEEEDLKAWVVGLVLGLFWPQFVLVFFEEPGNTALPQSIYRLLTDGQTASVTIYPPPFTTFTWRI